ncbi:MAG: DUF4292 domain-containing protein [Ignavibacteriota bacterium]|nr:DUF4292 domain-containing protein [Ignavibacteriota bacterium]
MKNIFLLFFLTLGVLTFSNLYSQTEDTLQTSNDTVITAVDTLSIKDSVRNAFLNSPERLKVVALINQVNETSAKVDLIHSESIVKFKTSSIDETGEIEIKIKKKDDLWFRIWGSFAFVSKDAFIAHFNRKKFIYFNNLDEKVIEGTTTDNNIGYLARIKCSFDDLMNVMSGTGSVVYSNTDTLSTENENVIVVKGKERVVKYTLDAGKKYVEKYSYYNSKKKEYLRVNFGNFINVNGGYFAKKVDITKPITSEYIKIVNENYTTNNQNMNFTVDFPSDVRRVKWDK